MRRFLGLSALVAATTIAAACGGTTPGIAGEPGADPSATTETQATTDAAAVPYSNDPGTVLVDVSTGAGFVPVTVAVDRRPTFRLYGDGTVLAASAGELEIGGFPTLNTYRLTEAGVAEALEAAQEAELLAPDPGYGAPPITDFGTTFVGIEVDAGRFEHAAYALGAEGDGAGLTSAELEARTRLKEFIARVNDLPSAGPDLLATTPTAYEPAAVDVYAFEYTGELDSAIVTADWPGQPLGTYPTENDFGARCGVLRGDDIGVVRDAVAGKDPFVVWRSGTKHWTVGFDLVLPGEEGCTEPSTAGTDVVAEGPQQQSGKGWRLLADAPQVGPVWDTSAATDPDAYATLWNEIGLAGDPPDVDFEREIVLHFGPAVSGSCDDIRLDGLTIEGDLVLPQIVLPGPVPGACTADANPHTYLLAVERAALPPPPFRVQLQPEPCPGCEGTDVTVVESLDASGA